MTDDIRNKDIDPWFVTWKLGDHFLDIIREYAEEIELEEGTTVFSHGDESDAMYLILKGMVIVLTKDDEGNEQTVSIISEGQSFGEVGLLVKQARLATTAAGLDVKLLKITQTALEKLEKKGRHHGSPFFKVIT